MVSNNNYGAGGFADIFEATLRKNGVKIDWISYPS